MKGTPPAAALIPPFGFYWLKVAQLRYVPSVKATAHAPEVVGYLTWDNFETEWRIAHVTDEHGEYFVIGNDCDFNWSDSSSVVIEVGPKLEPPSLYPIVYGTHSDKTAEIGTVPLLAEGFVMGVPPAPAQEFIVGFPEMKQSIPMRCPHCQQIGYISELAPVGIPWHCPKCLQLSDGKTWVPV